MDTRDQRAAPWGGSLLRGALALAVLAALALTWSLAPVRTGANQCFAPAVNYPIGGGTNPSAVAVGDFSDAGRLDLAVADSGGAVLSVLLGVGNGTFQPKVDYSTGANPSAIVVGDFDSDSWLDLAVANAGSGSVSVLL